jgi:putative toxin-antitoxin system antitoxin component (TIGR02293 family)
MAKSTSPRSVRSAKGAKPAAKAAPAAKASAMAMNFMDVFRADPMERVRWVKNGVSARTVDAMAKRMAMPKERLVGTLGLARATVDRKARENKPLSTDEGSRVLGMARLVGQVQAMVEESGNPDGFDAAGWVARWLERPLPALGGQRPAELMDTPEGQSLVSDVVARMQSGAYS